MTSIVTCSHCDHKLFLKKINTTPQVNDSSHEAQEQFDTLLKVYKSFPSSDCFSTLFPIHINRNTSCITTKFVTGTTLDNLLINNRSSTIKDTLFLTGKWLRLLHQAGNHTEIPNAIEEKRLVIQKKWSEYNLPKTIEKSLASLNCSAPLLNTKKCTGYWLHGDFTPNNILFDGQRLTGIDIGWRSKGISEMDLAPFLNHLEFICNSFRGRHIKKLFPVLKAAFLSGYFGKDEHDELLLNWYRLFFLLSYWASNNNNFFRKAYSNIEFGSITKEVTNRINSLI